MTEHSAQILATSWPSQSVMAWSGYAMSLSQAAESLVGELNTQLDIKADLAGMEGAFIEAARHLVTSRETALVNRIAAYRHISNKASWGASELQSTKTELTHIVNSAEEKIATSRTNAEQAKAAAAAVPGAVEQIESQLQTIIANLVATAKAEAIARDMQGAGTVAALSADIANWAAPYINNMLPGSGSSAPDAGSMPATPAVPAPKNPYDMGQKAEYNTSNVHHPDVQQGQQTKELPNKEAAPDTQALRNDIPEKTDPADLSRNRDSGMPSSPSTPSSPASSGSPGGSGNPASSLGQVFKPASSTSSSPGSASSPGNAASANPGAAAQSSQLAKPTPGGSGVPGGVGRGAGLAGAGAGLADSAARLTTGAVGTGANVASGALNSAGVAQNAVQAASTPPPPPSSGPPPAGGSPMGMMPATSAAAAGGGGSSVVNPVGSNPGAANVTGGPASTTPASPTVNSGAGSVGPGSAAGGSVAPVPVQGPGIRGVGADGAAGDMLFEQAADAGRDVISALVGQSLGVGYIAVAYAVAVVYERGGTVSAWLATGEGPSYIPWGVRIPQNVQLSVTDPVAGRELWEASAAAGGLNPLEVVVRQAQAREQTAPGSRVLAIASSLPMNQVGDWAGEVGARAVSVDPKSLAPLTTPDAGWVHRCAAAMPWEWRQANAFSEQERLQVAMRHMHMAATAGRLRSSAAEKIMELFESRKPIDQALWHDVDRDRYMALIEWELAMKSAGQGGSDPARLLAPARAAEVVGCLRNYATAEGCADILYASRLAGAPLNPAAAVA